MPGNPLAPRPIQRRNGFRGRVEESIIEDLRRSHAHFLAFNREVGLTDDVISEAVFPTDDEFVVSIENSTGPVDARQEGLRKVIVVLDAGQILNVVHIVIRTSAPQDAVDKGHPALIFPHSQIVAWWLMMNWRTNELASAFLDLVETNYSAAATVARSLVETAATLVEEAQKIEKLWNRFRQASAAKGSLDGETWLELQGALVYLSASSKWSDRSLPIKEMFDRVERRNVLTSIGLLDRRLGGKDSQWVQEGYEILCNFSHPGQLNFVAFEGRSYVTPKLSRVRVFTSSKLGVFFEDLHEDQSDPHASTIITLVNRCLSTAIEALDEALKVIDDISLSVQLRSISPFDTWRLTSVGKRNESCPCRSGRKSKDCNHDLYRSS